jgi:multiple sugar transport system substrate-binding protein
MAELAYPKMSRKIQLAKTPQGPVRRMGQYYVPGYFIWKFADNIEGAKQFLIDFVGNLRKAFVASKFRDFPCFPDTTPDLKSLIAKDSRGLPPTKYNVLKDVPDWTTNMGFPGYANAAIGEVAAMNVIPDMFSKAATGEAKPEDAVKEAETACKDIFDKWTEKGAI